MFFFHSFAQRARRANLLPLLVAFRLTDQQGCIAEDVEAWCRHRYREAGPVRDELLDLGRAPEFRSIFYYRLRQGNVGGRRAAKVLRRILKPLPMLDLATDHIGGGLMISHGFGTVLNAERIGRNFWVHQGVTVGWDYLRGRPTIGDDVFVGTGAAILGPVTVGDGAIIGANAVVTKDVAPGATAVGVPAREVARGGGPSGRDEG